MNYTTIYGEEIRDLRKAMPVAQYRHHPRRLYHRLGGNENGVESTGFMK